MIIAATMAIMAPAQSGAADTKQPQALPAAPTPTEPAGTVATDGVSPAVAPVLGDASQAQSETAAQTSPAAPAVQTGPAAPVAQSGPAASPTAAPADVVVTARAPGDPLRKVNEQTFAATQAVDDAITGPAALAYKRAVPDPVRSGLRNFFNNLHEPTVALNYALQLKPGKAAETIGRFALNTTIGIGGLFDVAKGRPFRLPRRPNGFGDTLGFYGVGPGPYFFLPLIGPTTVRDFIGGTVDRLGTVSYLRGPFSGRAYILSTGAVRVLDRRAEADDRVRTVRESADPYETRRSLYMHKRQAEIDQLHGHRPNPPTPPPTGGTTELMPPIAVPAPATAAEMPDQAGSDAATPRPAAS